jgi:hypothetical protein
MRPTLHFLAFLAPLLGACYSAGDGEPPVLSQIYFPTGLALDVVDAATPPQHLYVASSDFDLQYRASALASYDLATIDALVQHNCNVDSDCAGVLGTKSLATVCDNLDAGYNSGTAEAPLYAPSYFCVDPPQNGVVNPCGPVLQHSAADLLLYPGRCQSFDANTLRPQGIDPLIRDTVEIGAFATDVVFKPTPIPADGTTNTYTGRLFMPVRGDATLHWVDVTPDLVGSHPDGTPQLYCGQQNTDGNGCDGLHRIGDDARTESPNDVGQEPEPFAIAIDDVGKNIAVTNQTTGSVSLYVNQWSAPTNPTDSMYPEPPISLVNLLAGLPTAPVGITAVPMPLLLDQSSYRSGFLAVYRDAPQVDLLRVQDDPLRDPKSPPSATNYGVQVLARAASIPINTNSNGSDSRGIAIDHTQRDSDYEACLQPYPACAKEPLGNYLSGAADVSACACPQAPGDALNACKAALQTCLQAVHQPSVFVANRAPASLVIGALGQSSQYASGTSELPAFTDSVPLSVGPSRVVLGKVRVPSNAPDAIVDASGNYILETRVFVVCFDSRKIYIYDPARHVIDSIVSTGRGPYALVIDDQRGRGYVAHFTDSYLGVISLDQRFPQNYASIVASVGVPSAPRASK